MGGRQEKQHQKCRHKEQTKPNQYSNYMRVSILLCYCVTILKSPNYAHKNLSYAYICMKVFSFSMTEIDKPGSRVSAQSVEANNNQTELSCTRHRDSGTRLPYFSQKARKQSVKHVGDLGISLGTASLQLKLIAKRSLALFSQCEFEHCRNRFFPSC